MANQTANAAQVQITTNTYASTSSLASYSLGDGQITISQSPSTFQSTQFHENGVLPQAPPTSPTVSKRKPEDDEQSPSARKRRVKVFDVETSEVVSGEPRQIGARHWTDQEKGKLFSWLLGRDDSWEGFSTQMNTVFRDGSARVFDNKKTFTAIKSCYHRNVETFKQMYAFERYLIQVTSLPDPPAAPPPGFVPLPASFASSSDRLAFLDQQLDVARALPVETGIGNLSAKVVEHWCRKGWYVLFKRRFKEDLSTGQIIPFFGKDPSLSLLGRGFSAPAAVLFPQPDVSTANELAEDEDADATAVEDAAAQDVGREHDFQQNRPESHDADGQGNSVSSATASAVVQQSQPTKAKHRKKTPAAIASSTARFRVSQPDTRSPLESQSQLQTQQQQQQSPSQASQGSPPMYNGTPVSAYSAYPPHSYPATHLYPQPSPHFDLAQTYPYAMHNPQVQQVSQLAQNLINVCTTLVEQLRAQAEDGKALLDLMRKREERAQAVELSEKEAGGAFADRKERAALATQVLANPHAGEEVKQAATDFLKRLFM